MTRQEKLILAGVLAALLLGAAVRGFRRHGGDLPHPSLKSGPLSP